MDSHFQSVALLDMGLFHHDESKMRTIWIPIQSDAFPYNICPPMLAELALIRAFVGHVLFVSIDCADEITYVK
jgi:hypothetical protein